MKVDSTFRLATYAQFLLGFAVVVALLVSAVQATNVTSQESNVTGQTSNTIIVELKNPCDDATSNFKDLLPIIVGGSLTLIGVLFAAFFDARRESARAKFEWGKFLFERYEQYYREFIIGLTGTLNANQIKEYFKRLNDSAFVTNNLRTKVNETLNVLESNASTDEKKIARDNLLYDFEQFMQKPWGP